MCVAGGPLVLSGGPSLGTGVGARSFDVFAMVRRRVLRRRGVAVTYLHTHGGLILELQGLIFRVYSRRGLVLRVYCFLCLVFGVLLDWLLGTGFPVSVCLAKPDRDRQTLTDIH